MGQTGREGKAGKFLRRAPQHFAGFRPRPRLAREPGGDKGQYDIMAFDPPGEIADDMLNRLVEADEPRQYAGFLAQFAQGGGFERLSSLDQTTRKGEHERIGRRGAGGEQNLTPTEDRNADGKRRLGGIMTARIAQG